MTPWLHRSHLRTHGECVEDCELHAPPTTCPECGRKPESEVERQGLHSGRWIRCRKCAKERTDFYNRRLMADTTYFGATC